MATYPLSNFSRNLLPQLQNQIHLCQSTSVDGCGNLTLIAKLTFNSSQATAANCGDLSLSDIPLAIELKHIHRHLASTV